MKFAYHKSDTPPAPIIEIQLAYPEANVGTSSYAALIDTGADGTLIPKRLLDEIGAPLIDQVRVRNHWGEWHYGQLYAVDIAIGDHRLPAVEVVGDTGDEIILGRNVINLLSILLDGPHQQLNVNI